jgi:hypothetical protein
MSSCHQPGGAVERRSVVVTAARLGFAGVQADAHAQGVWMDLIPRRLCQGLLGLKGRGLRDRSEGGMDTIAVVLIKRPPLASMAWRRISS